MNKLKRFVFLLVFSAPALLTDQTSTTYVATFDGTIIRLYKNGAELSTSNAISVNPRINSIPLLFGQSRNDSFVN